MMLYVSIGTLFWTHILAGIIPAVVCSAYIYFKVKK